MTFVGTIRMHLRQRLTAESYRHVAAATGINVSVLHGFAAGDRGCSMQTLDILRKYLGLKIERVES